MSSMLSTAPVSPASPMALRPPMRSIPVSAPDFVPAAPVRAFPACGSEDRIAGPMDAARACLEDPFRPVRKELASFLVNGLYLFGPSRILEWEPRDGTAAEDLKAAGHAVEYAGAGGAPPPAGRFDRAMLVSRALGYRDEETDGRWLATMHRALRPGGLLLFPVFDRDRAWSLAGGLRAEAARLRGGTEGGRADFAFDPATGNVTARIRSVKYTGTDGKFAGGMPAPSRGASSVRAFNLTELGSLLAGAGFALERAYGTWAGGGLSGKEGSGRILVVAAKPRRSYPRWKGSSRPVPGIARGVGRQRTGKGGAI
ncbi:MAG TPA: hypothetical protein VK465_00655 [Fibrobacteria bacterium]|nr:hypothetical protein [Fibrobacteria bacterium]